MAQKGKTFILPILFSPTFPLPTPLHSSPSFCGRPQQRSPLLHLGSHSPRPLLLQLGSCPSSHSTKLSFLFFLLLSFQVHQLKFIYFIFSTFGFDKPKGKPKSGFPFFSFLRFNESRFGFSLLSFSPFRFSETQICSPLVLIFSSSIPRSGFCYPIKLRCFIWFSVEQINSLVTRTVCLPDFRNYPQIDLTTSD